MKHLDVIEWPNGKGCTPCTLEYRNALDEAASIKPNHVNMDDLSPAEYQRWNELQDKLAQMQMSGHLGKSIKY